MIVYYWPMRKVILGFGMTIDGYIARRDHSVDYLVMDKEAGKIMAEFWAGIDTTIMGRKTAEATGKMQKDAEMPEIGGVKNYVFSRKWKAGPRKGYAVVNQSPAAFLKRLRKTPGKDIFLMGGGELGRSFLRADLVDELYLGLVPILLGAGRPGFPAGFPQRDFKLIEFKPYSSGVTLRYERVRTKVKSKKAR